MSVRFLTVVVDCADPRTLSHRWAEATGYRRSADRDEWASIVGEGDRHIRIGFQTAESKVVKNRVHADLGAPDIEVEAQRLEGFGATR